MKCKAYVSILVCLAISFLMSCSSTNMTPAPQTIAPTSGQVQGTAIGTSFQTRLQATVSAGGVGVPLAPVTFTVVPSVGGAGATFANGMTTETDTTSSSGAVFSSTLTANTTFGSYTVVATSPGTTTTATFTLTNYAGAPATITVTSGSGQSASVGTAFADPLVATVLDGNGNPVSNVTVIFTAPSGGAAPNSNPSCTFANGTGVDTVVTGSNGQAKSSVCTANTIIGTYIVVANSVPAVNIPADFTLTNTP